MKKMKKILAILLAAVMVMGMSVTVFAEGDTPSSPLTPATMKPATTPIAEDAYPTSADRVDVKIGGITGNPTITLYQVASADYGKDGRNGFIQYKWVEANEIDFEGMPTSKQITEMANALVNGKLRVDGNSKAGILDSERGIYTANVAAGAYIAVITGADDGSVYNPVLLTATYNATEAIDGSATGAELIGGSINVINAHYLNGLVAVAKKTTPSINKTITDSTVTSDDTITGNKLPDGTNTTSTPAATANATVSVGDSVEYTITPELPSYPVEARNKKLAISDRTSAGLTFQFGTLEMVLDGRLETVKSEADDNGIVTFTYDGKVIAYAKAIKENGATGFNMTFVYDNLIHGDEGFVYVPTLTYKAVVNDSAVVGSTGNTNTTTLYYTNQPNTDSDYDPSTSELPTGEDVKEKTDKETVYTYQLAFLKTGEGSDSEGLADAVFGIYSSPACTEDTLVDVVTTNEKGYAVSSQVSAGKYYIKEISAPDGYSLNDDVFEVEACWKNAVTTIKGATTRRTYTATKPSEDALQVGWLDTENVFYKLDIAVTYERNTIISVDTGKALVPAYLATETTTANSEKFEESNDVTGTVTEIKNLMTNEEHIVNIPNTRLAALPSTGGIGTTIFTIGGCAIMVIAAGLFFATRRKFEK